jgi:Arc/MetJ-type ribon-helix-helix transcriptional regulator
MPRPKTAYIAALPLSAVPELQELLCRFAGPQDRRSNVVMVRLNDDAVVQLDLLVDAGLFGSRSEAAAFLVGAGIEANRDLLVQTAKHGAEIKKVREQLRQAIVKSLRAGRSRPTRSAGKRKSK